jgi:hypothetical protein
MKDHAKCAIVAATALMSTASYLRNWGRLTLQRGRTHTAVWVIAVVLLSSATLPALAADLGQPVAPVAATVFLDPSALDAEIAAASKAGTTRKVLGALAKAARRLGGWFLWARDVADALDELLRVMDDARYAAQLRTKVDDLEKKLAALEQVLAGKPKPERGDDTARRFFDILRQEIARTRAPHRPCPTAQHRVFDGTCKDRRLLDTPTAR